MGRTRFSALEKAFFSAEGYDARFPAIVDDVLRLAYIFAGVSASPHTARYPFTALDILIEGLK